MNEPVLTEERREALELANQILDPKSAVEVPDLVKRGIVDVWTEKRKYLQGRNDYERFVSALDIVMTSIRKAGNLRPRGLELSGAGNRRQGERRRQGDNSTKKAAFVKLVQTVQKARGK